MPIGPSPNLKSAPFQRATKLGPAVPGDLALDCFELARDIRLLDMRASPYDFSSYGEPAVAIETPEGKAEYAAAQRDFAARGVELRRRLLERVGALPGVESVAISSVGVMRGHV